VTLKPPPAQYAGSGSGAVSVAVKRSSSLPEQGVPGGPLLSRDMLLGLVEGDQERLALLIRSRGGFAFWSKEGGLFGFGQHDLTMAANYLIYLGHLGAQVDGPQLLSPELASHPDFPEDGDLQALCSFLQQSGIVIPSTLAEADVSDIAGFKALRVFAKTRSAKANGQALKFIENLQGHRASLETGLTRTVPSQRSFTDPTASALIHMFAAAVGANCYGQLNLDVVNIWRRMALFPSSKFEPWLKAEHHAHLSSQLVTNMAEGTLRPFHFTSSYAVVVHQGTTKRDANISSVAVKAAPLTILYGPAQIVI
jgi:hypothetical protein